jgi:hypothetical protein
MHSEGSASPSQPTKGGAKGKEPEHVGGQSLQFEIEQPHLGPTKRRKFRKKTVPCVVTHCNEFSSDIEMMRKHAESHKDMDVPKAELKELLAATYKTKSGRDNFLAKQWR